MNTSLLRKALLLLVVAAPMPLVGCQPEGPAERAGEAVDNAARDVKDAVDPAGPMEKAGRSVDKAIDK